MREFITKTVWDIEKQRFMEYYFIDEYMVSMETWLTEMKNETQVVAEEYVPEDTGDCCDDLEGYSCVEDNNVVNINVNIDKFILSHEQDIQDFAKMIQEELCKKGIIRR